MDRILFPHLQPTSPPNRDRVYPLDKSALEQLLDQYFAVEQAADSNREMINWTGEQRRRGRSAQFYHVQPFPNGVYAPAFRDPNVLQPHRSWLSLEDQGWTAYPDERFDVAIGETRDLVLDANLQSPGGLAKAIQLELQRVLESDRSVRSKAIDRVIKGSSAYLGPVKLSPMLRRAWNGMRRLPYADSDIAICFGRITLLVASKIDEQLLPSHRRDHLTGLLGPVLQVAFGAGDGSGSQAWATIQGLTNCLRERVDGLLADEDKWRVSDPRKLFQVIYNPRLLFDFERLIKLFASELIPSQVLDERKLILFNPVSIATFGNP
jgi:hypothetical protein